MIEMNQSFADAFKQLLQSLQVRFIFPAAYFVVANLLLWPGKRNFDDGFQIVVWCTITVVISYLLNAFNGLIIRLVEGYTFQDNYLSALANVLEKRRLRRYEKRIQECDNKLDQITAFQGELQINGVVAPELDDELEQIASEWERKRGRLHSEKQFRFPSHYHLPTSFGNTIAAFESYPLERYHMSAVTLWPRLLPILEKENYTAFVQNEKSVMDFLLNTSLASFLLLVELLVIFNLHGFPTSYLLLLIVFPILVWLFYYAAVAAAGDWGIMVCSAFDLYRDALRQALHLPRLPDESLDQEKKLWKAISLFISHGHIQDFRGFVYSDSRG